MDLHATKSLPTKIPGFAEEIGRADRVLVVLSDKYLHSPNCMRELLHLFQRSQGDRADVLMPRGAGGLDAAIERLQS